MRNWLKEIEPYFRLAEIIFIVGVGCIVSYLQIGIANKQTLVAEKSLEVSKAELKLAEYDMQEATLPQLAIYEIKSPIPITYDHVGNRVEAKPTTEIATLVNLGKGSAHDISISWHPTNIHSLYPSPKDAKEEADQKTFVELAKTFSIAEHLEPQTILAGSFTKILSFPSVKPRIAQSLERFIVDGEFRIDCKTSSGVPIKVRKFFRLVVGKDNLQSNNAEMYLVITEGPPTPESKNPPPPPHYTKDTVFDD